MFCTEQIAIELHEKCPKECANYLLTALKDGGLSAQIDKCLDTSFITVKTSFKDLCNKADEVELLKELEDSSGLVHEFVAEDLKKFKGHNEEKTFFTSSEQLYLLECILHAVKFSKDAFIKAGLKKFGASESILTGCIHSTPPIVQSFTPLHNEELRKQLWKDIRSHPVMLPKSHDKVSCRIRDYYGEEVAFYFAWMSFFNWALIPIAIFGVALFLHRPKGITVDDSPYLPAYALLMALWIIVYLKCWRRKEHEIALTWGTSNIEKNDAVRPEFHGILRRSPITGNMEKYFPSWKRRIRYLVSFILTLPFLSLGVGAMILSLNLNGYIKHKESPIRFHSLSQYAEPGGIFAGDSPYYGWMIPTIGHSIVINLISRVYRVVATYSTDIENHKTEHQWDGSHIIKRVLFELFDCYLPLFYIAFYQLDIVSLRRELIGLFWGDEIRRLATESLLPFMMEKIQAKRNKKKMEEYKKDDAHNNLEVYENLSMEEYEQFDDYLEMVVQFGYVTLFASAFPLCSIITIVFLFLEERSDMFKLLFLCRRPVVKRAKNIGVWFKVLTAMMILSMVTNCFLFGFASEQLASWAPVMYETHEDGDQYIIPGYGRYVVGIVFCAEHVLIMCVGLSHYLISDVPNHVRIELARREYLKKEEIKMLKLKVEKEEEEKSKKRKNKIS